MSKVKQAQEFFAGAQTLTTIANTYRPVLDGSRRSITKVGKSYFQGEVLDGDAAGQSYYSPIPTRAADILHIDEKVITYRLKREGHTVTFERS